MGRNRRKRWNSCLVWFATSLGALSLTLSTFGASAVSDGEATHSKFPTYSQQNTACSSTHEDNRKVIIVSTLDGKLSALDGSDNGQLLWSLAVDSRPLLSSSISKMEIMHDGVPTRYIPALDGGLYRYDGESIEALPMTAETLLSSSFKLADDTVMIGGKDTLSYGINPVSGKVRYMCGAKGCRVFGDNVQDDEDVLVVTRNAQCVRAVDSRTGLEKWNFSVGNHDLGFLAGQRQRITEETEVDAEDDDVSITTCPSSEEEEEVEVDMETFAQSIKIMVPDGKVVGVNPENMQVVTWQHKFNSPVSNVWLLHRGNMEKIDMFGNNNIPALSGFGPEVEPTAPPLLYIGMHQNQLYVQPSPQMGHKMMESMEKFSSQHTSALCGRKNRPRIAWKPYLNTAQWRTPSMNHKRPEIGQEEGQHCEQEEPEGALTIWHEDYPFDNGFYLYPEFSVALPLPEDEAGPNENQSSHYEPSLLDDYLPVTLWNWWKEVVAISVLTSLVVHLVLSHLQKVRTARLALRESSGQSQSQSLASLADISEGKMSDPNLASRQNSDEAEFVSRYVSDFEHIQVLGKGGFGVVFETKNKVDECPYAVKRIALPNNPGAKEKVMREVRALAKLDHVGIVRYFNAWYESPPLGWQEEQDGKLEASVGMTSPSALSEYGSKSIQSSVPSRLPFELSSKSPETAASERLNTNNNNRSCFPNTPSSPFDLLQNPFGQNILDLSETAIKRGGSEEFAVHSSSHWSDFGEESGSFSYGTGTPNLSRLNMDHDDSVDIEFAASDHDVSCDQSNILSEGNSVDIGHSNDSFQVIFEDSGCADRNSRDSSDEVCIGMSSQSHDLLEEHENNSTNQSEASIKTHKRTHSRSKSLSKDFTTKLTCINEKENNREINNEEKEEEKEKPETTKKLFLYIQMQLCMRETLKDWLTNNTLSRDRHMVLDMFDQIACAVEYVHDCGLMHRDLKPSNIFFSLDGTIKVGDFGLVTALPEEQNEVQFGSGSPFRKHTAQVGTQLYMSIEQSAGKLYSRKVDIFSLGVILFELLYPFTTAMERVMTLQKVRKQVFPERFSREMPTECEFVRRLLSPCPEERPDINEILSHDLLKEFTNRRMPRRFRTRTVSQNSNNSN